MPATDKYSYDLKKLHVIFAISCVLILVATILMMVKDHNDEWRGYQKTGFRVEAAAQNAELSRYETDELQARRDEVSEKLTAANEKLDSAADKRAELDENVKALAFEQNVLARKLRSQNADRDVARANYDIGVRDVLEPDALNSLRVEFESRKNMRDVTELELQAAEKKLAAAKSAFNEFTKEQRELSSELKKLNSDKDRITAAMEKIAPTGVLQSAKRSFMEWPIIDGFNSHMRITQDWLPDLHQTLGMTSTARFDRCRTCHMMIDRTAAGNVAAFPAGDIESDNVEDWVAENKFPQPYSTHPNVDLYCTSSSPHPVSSFGCTICHDGQGSGTSFGNAEHSPNDPHQFEEWHHKYGFHPNHYWEYPMLPNRFVESSCIKCHHSVTELGTNPKFGATAPKVVKGYNLIKEYGCFGCHEIHGYDGGEPIGPDIRLEPLTAEEKQKVAEDPKQIAGMMRKVGPSLRHIAYKTTEQFVAYWTEEPKKFRPNTRMPQFFNLTNQRDVDAGHDGNPHGQDFAEKVEPAELQGIAHFLFAKSQPLDLLKPTDGYQPDVKRGKQLFSERGCLACHSHKDFAEVENTFGPNLSRIHEKVNRTGGFSNWLYTWIREPERHHARTRMPNLYLETYELDGKEVDPAADITAYLLSAGETGNFGDIETTDEALDELVKVFLAKNLTQEQLEKTFADRKYPIDAKLVKGDEIELTGEGEISEEEWRAKKLNYVGRRTISRYGCYGCHDIPGFEKSRPIGAALQDWGRKDTSKLAPEHIEEYMHHHGEADGSSTMERVSSAIKDAIAGGAEKGYFDGDEEKEAREMSAAYFYHSLTHHGRAGFIWQKLRQPRSYDYKKIETKGYDERLRMPKFPFTEDEIEAIATFVLGLVADPPAEQYLYRPSGPAKDRIGGEQLIEKYNCTGCHMLELPEIKYGADLASIKASKTPDAFGDDIVKLLNKLRPPRQGLTGEKVDVEIDEDGETEERDVLTFHGLRLQFPEEPDDPLVDQTHTFTLWENLLVGDKQIYPTKKMNITGAELLEVGEGRGGAWTEWLVQRLMKTRRAENDGLRDKARQQSAPPLYKEGTKVQTAWLYEFLLEPAKIRHTTVLRMPKFNMSKDEAQTLANYFAAVDGVAYPYQDNSPRDANYLAQRETETKDLLEGKDYLDSCWNTLNIKGLCNNCHAVGGKPYVSLPNSKDPRGPDLRRVAQRLRPDWVKLWVSYPTWITPYTSMPVNFNKAKPQYPELFKTDAEAQVIGVRDALMNYARLMESIGKREYDPKGAAPAGAGGAE